MKLRDTDGAIGDDGYIEIWNESDTWYFINFTENNPVLPTGVTIKAEL